jgi:hypothetical protein
MPGAPTDHDEVVAVLDEEAVVDAGGEIGQNRPLQGGKVQGVSDLLFIDASQLDSA